MKNSFSKIEVEYGCRHLLLCGEVLKDGDHLEVLRDGLIYWDMVILDEASMNSFRIPKYALLSCYLINDFNINNLLVRKL